MANFSSALDPTSTATKTLRLAGVVVKAHCSKPGFSTGIAEQANGNSFRYCSKIKALAIEEGDSLVFIGTMNKDKYGEQMLVQSVDASVAQTVEGLELYLAKSPKYAGIGPVAACKIAATCGSVDAFMREADAFCDNSPSLIENLIHEKKREMFKAAWEEDRFTFKARAELASFTLSPKQIDDLIAGLGVNAVQIIKRNPYMILEHVRGYGFRRLDQIITERMQGDKADPERIYSAALACFQDKCVERGSTRMDYAAFSETLHREYLMMDTREQIATAQYHVALMFSGTHDQKPTLLALPEANNTITTVRMHEREAQIMRSLDRALSAGFNIEWTEDLDEVDEMVQKMTEEQRRARWNAITRACSVIIGGAGVGKTYTMASIVRRALADGLTVELGAFTGKAAARMTEMLRESGIMDEKVCGKTLHRILGADGNGFRRGDLHEVYQGMSGALPKIDLLIIDEASMLDVFLAHEVFTRWNPEKTSIVLIGDAAQLPSVGAGNILHDILTRKLAPIVELTKIQRQGGALAKVCQQVRTGNIPQIGVKDDFGEYRAVDIKTASARMGEQMHYQQDPAKYAIGMVRRMFTDWIPTVTGFNIDQVQIVCPFRDLKQPINTASINRAVQEHLWGAACGDVNVGDRIMQTENDYDIGVFNGQFGKILEVDNPKRPKRVKVRFDQIPVGADEEGNCVCEWKKLEVAYAVTVHKSQGSQFPAVIFACGAAPAGMLVDRSLIYTGISRAAKFAAVVGDLASIANCARIHTASMRMTNLSLIRIAGEKK